MHDKKKETQHEIFEKMLRSGMRIKTESEHIIVNKDEQANDRKKIISRNYRRQILKRKKMLTDKEDCLKFKRF